METKILKLDELTDICGYFNSGSPVNNGDGCNHKDCDDQELLKNIERDWRGWVVNYKGVSSVKYEIYERHRIFNQKQLDEIKKDKIYNRFFEKLQKDEYANIFTKEVGAVWFGRCFSFSCPLASKADLECLKEHNHWGYEEWKDEEYDPTEAGGDFMYVYDEEVLSRISD